MNTRTLVTPVSSFDVSQALDGLQLRVSTNRLRIVMKFEARLATTRHRASTSMYSLTFLRSRYVAIATQPVPRLQIRPIVHK